MNRRKTVIMAVLILAAGAVGEGARSAVKAQERDLARLKRLASESRQHWQKLRRELAGTQTPPVPDTVEDPVPASGDAAYDGRMRVLVEKVYRLKHWIEATAGEDLPEFRFANDSDWFQAVGGNTLQDERDLRRAATSVKERAQFNFLDIVESALRGYAQVADGQLPKTMAELAPFFVCPIDDGMLNRYEIVATGSREAANGQAVIQERVAAGQATRFISVNRMGARIAATSPRAGAAENRTAAEMAEVSEALMKFQREHQGLMPKDAEELRPYVTHPEVLQRYRPWPRQ